MESGEMLSGDLVLDVGGEHYELNLTIPATPVTPQRMLPVFQKLTNDIVARAFSGRMKPERLSHARLRAELAAGSRC
jgi:hypothetical protein